MTKILTLSNTAVPFCGYTPEDNMPQSECDRLNRDEAKRVAGIILAQMGGHKFCIMVGAVNFSSHYDEGLGALSFRFKGSRKVNYCKIILAANDTYSMRFGKIKQFEYDVVAFETDVHAPELNETFTRVTGLDTCLPLIQGINA